MHLSQLYLQCSLHRACKHSCTAQLQLTMQADLQMVEHEALDLPEPWTAWAAVRRVLDAARMALAASSPAWSRLIACLQSAWPQ